MEFRRKFRGLLGIAMLAAGIGCLTWAIVFGHPSAWWAAAMCLCSTGVCFAQRRKPSEEG